MESIKSILIRFDIIDEKSIVEFYHRTRDREDQKVFKCQRSGVIFIDNSSVERSGIGEDDSVNYLKYMGLDSYQEVVNKTLIDDTRRFNLIKELIVNKTWIDVGAGFGGLIRLGNELSKKTIAIEPQKEAAKILRESNIKTFDSLQQVPKEIKPDIVTLFHVFEHMKDPFKELKDIHDLLNDSGKLVIEVPNASDFLIEQLNCNDFKKFTLWSEHLILHTRKSLEIFLAKAGFDKISIFGVQRYSIANHLYWLKEGKPGGHIRWSHLNDPALNSAYENLLNKLNMTDTLIAVADKQ